MKLMSLIATASLALVLCGCGVNNAVVKVNNEAISRAQYDKAFDAVAKNSMFTQMGIDVKKDENSFVHLMLKERVMNELIIKKLIDQEVKNRKIKVSQDDLDKKLKTIIDQVGSKEKLNKMLKEHGVSSAQFKKDLYEEVKIQKLVDSLKIVAVSDNDAKKFYDENKPKFIYPDRVRASHILVSANPEEIAAEIKATDDGAKLSEGEIAARVDKEMVLRKEKAQKLLSEIRKNQSDFAKFAKDNSDDLASAKQGGDLGFFAKEEMVEPFSKAAFSMKPNTLSDVVQTPYGYHIILVVDRQQSGVDSFEKVKPEIKEYLTNAEKLKALQQFVDNLKNTAKVEYVDESFNPENIKKKVVETRNAIKESQKTQNK